MQCLQLSYTIDRYLADITKEVFSDVEKSKYQLMEPRISIYGRNIKEWSNLGAWTYNNRVTSKHIRWMVQIPRLYGIYKKIGLVQNFQDMLNNIFTPLFEVTKNPASDLKLHWYLKHLIAFDCVDDESKAEPRYVCCCCVPLVVFCCVPRDVYHYRRRVAAAVLMFVLSCFVVVPCMLLLLFDGT